MISMYKSLRDAVADKGISANRRENKELTVKKEQYRARENNLIKYSNMRG